MKKKLLLITVLVVMVLLITGCTKEYVLPTEVLTVKGETPQQVSDSINKYKETNFREEEFGTAYLNGNGELCFKLDPQQKENWYKKGSDGIFTGTIILAQRGITFVCSEDMEYLFVIIQDNSAIDDIEEGEEIINAYIGDILMKKFFKNDAGEPLTLETTVMDKDGNTFGVVTWPDTTGYFANMD